MPNENDINETPIQEGNGLEDLPVDEASTDDVKGGPGVILVSHAG